MVVQVNKYRNVFIFSMTNSGLISGLISFKDFFIYCEIYSLAFQTSGEWCKNTNLICKLTLDHLAINLTKSLQLFSTCFLQLLRAVQSISEFLAVISNFALICICLVHTHKKDRMGIFW